MNQLREWDGACQKCFTPSSKYAMSIFDVSLICIHCSQQENKDAQQQQLQNTKNKSKLILPDKTS